MEWMSYCYREFSSRSSSRSTSFSQRSRLGWPLWLATIEGLSLATGNPVYREGQRAGAHLHVSG